MGCCQNRDEANKAFLTNNPNNQKHRTRSLSIDLRLKKVDQESLILATSLNTTDSNESMETNEKNLLLYLQTCAHKRKWEQLAPMLANQTEIKDSNICLSWTNKPKTIACVTLVHLGVALKKFATQVSPYIEVFLPLILAFIKSGSMDLKENAIFLLHYYVDYAAEKAIVKMITLKIFDFLAKFLLSSKNDLRKFSANLCYKIYKERTFAKLEFIKANGGFYLIQLIGWYGDNDFLEDLLRNLEELITTNGEFPIESNIADTAEPLSLKILKNIDLSGKPLEIRLQLDKLISLYQSR